MDIDSPPAVSPTHAPALNLPTFSSAFPLPFRVLALIGLAVLLWAVNVHVLTVLGVDVGWAVDLGGSEEGSEREPERGGDGDGDVYAEERERVEDVLFEYNNNNNRQPQQQQPTLSTSKPTAVPVDFSDDLPRPSFDGYGRTVVSPGGGGAGGTTTVGTRAVFVFPSSRNGSVVSFPGGGDDIPHGGGGGGRMGLASFFRRDGDTNMNDDDDDDNDVGENPRNRDRPTPSSVYRSIYALFLVYSLYVSSAWFLFRLMTRPTDKEVEELVMRSVAAASGSSSGGGGGGSGSGTGGALTWHQASGQAERQKMEQYRAFVGLAVGGLAVMGFGTGFGYGRWKVGERERQSLLRCVFLWW